MASLIEQKAKESAVILQRSGIKDGKSEYGKEIPCKCFIIDSIKENDEHGIINGKTFYVAPLGLDTELLLPAKIIYKEKTYDVMEIKTYRNLDNILIGYKLSVAGAQ